MTPTPRRTPRLRRWIERGIALLAGLVIALLVVEVGLRLGAGWFMHAQQTRAEQALRDADSPVVLCLGESTTAMGGDDSWPSQLQDALRERSGREITVINAGVPAATTPVLMLYAESALARYEPAVVVAMMGVNDGMGLTPGREALIDRSHPALEIFRSAKLVRHLWLDHRDRADAEARTEAAPHPWLDPSFDPEPLLHDEAFIAWVGEFGSIDDLERALRGDIEAGTPNIEAHRVLARILWDQGRVDEVLAVLDEGVRAFPEDPRLTVEHATFVAEKGDLDAAEAILRQALEAYPDRVEPGVALGRFLQTHRMRPDLALPVLEQAVALGPVDAPEYDTGLFELASYLIEEDPEAARRWVDLLRQRKDLPPRYRYLLIAYHQKMGEMQVVVEMLDELPQELPSSPRDLMDLGSLYDSLQMPERALTVYEAGARQHPNNELLLTRAAHAYRVAGRHGEAAAAQVEAEAIRDARIDPVTRESYRWLVEETRSRGAALVAVQYPRMDVNDLRQLVGEDAGVLFVDNGPSFEEAIARSGYDRLFIDRFTHQFGHCTREGNRLIAANVAEVIADQLLAGPAE